MGIVIRKTISTAIINYLGVVLGVINVLWLQTAVITELQIGILSYIFDVTILLFPFILFGTSGLPARFLHLFKEPKAKNGFINLLFLVPLITLAICLMVFLLFQEQIIHMLGNDTVKYQEFLIYVLPLLICYIYQYLLEAILATKSLTVFSSFLKNIFRRLVLMSLFILYGFDVVDFNQLVYWYVLAHFVEVIFLFMFFQKKHEYRITAPRLMIEPEKRKEIISYALYLILGVSGVVMVGKIDSVMISSITDNLEQLGIYAIAFYVATLIELPKRIVHQLAFPIMSKLVTEKKEDELEEMFQQTGINMAIIGLFLFLLIWFNIDALFEIIPNGEVYAAGKWVVFFVGISKVLDVIFGTNDLLINATKHFKWNGFLIPFLILSTLISNYILINSYGIVGAALATSITIFLYSAAKYILVLAKLKMNMITPKHVVIGMMLSVVCLVFFIKPQLLQNNFLEIGLNSLIITVIFIGGNYWFKSSAEMNNLINKLIKKS